MLSLKKVNFEDIVEEYRFVSSVPAEEKSFVNEWADVSREEFREKAIAVMINYSNSSGLPEGYVPESMYFLWEEGHIIGWFRIRHHLCESLVNGSGHIGYYISPQYRGKGFGTKGLQLAIRKAQKIIPEDEIYLRADIDNLPSISIMLNNGGYIHHKDDKKVYVRIPLKKQPQQ